MATKQRCPKCNGLNDLDAPRCQHCNAALLQVCPTCGAARPWYVQTCANCDAHAGDAALFTGIFRERSERRLQGRYLLHEALANGAVSTVYRATDLHDPSLTYAIKELSPVALFRADERRQAEASLAHAVARWQAAACPGVARVLDLFVAHDRHYVVSEYVPGWSLRQVIAERRAQVSPDLARNWGSQLCTILACLHRQDPPLYAAFLAPEHVVVTREGELRLVGLGLGTLFTPNPATPMGGIRGYGAPELAHGQAGPQSDVFAVGRLLYALLTGQLLERGSSGGLTLQRAVPGITTQLVRAISRAAQRDPAQRFATASEFLSALWGQEYGPLTPDEEWQRPLVTIEAPPTPAADAPTARRRAAPPPAAPESEGMAAFGFTRDPKYGAVPAGRSAAARPGVPAAPVAPAVEPGRISIYPRSLRLADLAAEETRKVVLTLRNAGPGPVACRVVSQLDWLRAPQKAIQLPAEKQARVILTVSAKGIPSGAVLEPQGLAVESASGRQWVSVEAEVAGGPLLRVESPLLDYGRLEDEGERIQTLVVANVGRQPLVGRVTAQVPWLHVARPELRCAAGASVAVPVRLVTARLPRGPQTVEAALLVDSDGGQERVAAHAHLLQPELDLGASHMDFGTVRHGEIAERLLYLGNRGDGVITGTVRSLLPWVQAHPEQVLCAAGELVQITLTADCVGLADGALDIPQALRVQTNAGTRTLSLHMVVSAPRLVLETPDLDFGAVTLGQAAERTLIIRNAGSAPLEGTLQALAPWLAVSQPAFRCAPGEALAIAVRADTAAFDHGQEIVVPAALRLVAGAEIVELPARIAALRPALRIEPDELDFGYVDRAQPETRTLIIANDGTGRLAWNVQTDALWVEIAPQNGVCDAGAQTEVTLTAYGLGLDAGAQAAQATLIVNSDGGRAKIPLRLALAAPLIAVDTAYLDLGSSINRRNVSGSFRIFNHGLGLLRGELQADETWLALDHASFECPTGRSVEVRVTGDMEEFPHGATNALGTVHLRSNGGEIDIEAALNVVLAAELAAEAVELAATPDDPALQGRLTVRNLGLETCHAELAASHPDLIVARDRCDVKPGKSARIAVQWRGADPPADGLVVEIRYDDRRVQVPIHLAASAGHR